MLRIIAALVAAMGVIVGRRVLAAVGGGVSRPALAAMRVLVARLDAMGMLVAWFVLTGMRVLVCMIVLPMAVLIVSVVVFVHRRLRIGTAGNKAGRGSSRSDPRSAPSGRGHPPPGRHTHRAPRPSPGPGSAEAAAPRACRRCPGGRRRREVRAGSSRGTAAVPPADRSRVSSAPPPTVERGAVAVHCFAPARAVARAPR